MNRLPSSSIDLDLETKLRRLGINLDDIVVTGVSVGLPNAGKTFRVCDPHNIHRLLNGECCISALDAAQKHSILDKNVTQVVKDKASGSRKPHVISSVADVLQLASFIGDFDLTKEYGVPPHVVEALDRSYQIAIAAGLEALIDAGIILEGSHPPAAHASEKHSGHAREQHAAHIHEHHRPQAHEHHSAHTREHHAGPPHEEHSKKPHRKWGPLPSEMQAETGVIFAASFPALDSLVDEVSKFLEHKLQRVSAEDTLKRIATHLGSSHACNINGFQSWDEMLNYCISGDHKVGSYHFNRKLLFQILVMANSQLAELIKARGPNTHLNAACASTSQAITVAEDWIRMGRCQRVVVISADVPTSPNLLSYIGTGFLSLGAATTKRSIDEAVLPFDAARSGMILGCGAVGIVLETETAALRRGARPKCQLIASHVVNSAFHAALMDSHHVAHELEIFLCKVERVLGIARAELAQDLMYMSHETCTASHGGCAAVEVAALRQSLGDKAVSSLLIANTKCFTAHPMGVGIEDAMCVAALDTGLVPPVLGVRNVDPRLGELNLSKGGRHSARYAMRFAAGFGSQFVYLLFGKYGQPPVDESTPDPEIECERKATHDLPHTPTPTAHLHAPSVPLKPCTLQASGPAVAGGCAGVGL
mmetsp:Transcript_27139/g.46786  ORF Transcript_27139/g.46786 Transcript_27139/m.46786 type:complete len:649 (+) Transcript_27139:112-2058(+)